MTDGPDIQPLPKKSVLLLVALPPACFAVAALLVFIFKGAAAVVFLVGMAVGSVLTGAGKFVILGGIAPEAPVGPLGLAMLVVAMDTAAATMLIPIMPLMYRMPWIGKYLRQVRRGSYELLRRNRWMKRFTFLGLLTYVAVPFGGTGGVGAVVLGRLLGLGRAAVVGGTALGATIGAATIFALARFGQEHVDAFKTNPYLTIIATAVVALASFVVLWRLLVTVARTRRESRTQGGGPDLSDPGLTPLPRKPPSGTGNGRLSRSSTQDLGKTSAQL